MASTVSESAEANLSASPSVSYWLVNMVALLPEHLSDTTLKNASAEDGVRALELSNAMHLSGWLGRPVSLPLDEVLFARLLQEKIDASVPKDTVDITYATSHQHTGARCGC